MCWRWVQCSGVHGGRRDARSIPTRERLDPSYGTGPVRAGRAAGAVQHLVLLSCGHPDIVSCAADMRRTWHASWVRNREFWDLVDEVFGRGYGRTLADDQMLTALGDRTAAQAVEAGVEPRVVWHALCDAMDVPDDKRWGHDQFRQAPPPR